MTSNNQLKPGVGYTNYTVRRAGMNSVTEESNPVSLDRPRPAVSHEVPGRVERPGPVTPPVGLGGARAAPCGGVAFANGRTPRRPHVMHVLDDEPDAPHVAHAEHA